MIRIIFGIILLGSSFISIPAFAQVDEPKIMFKEANDHFVKGEYTNAIAIYDDILEITPNNLSTLKMKAIALSNSGYHEKSLKEFFKILQYKPEDITALVGMGVGFGYLGEYKEAKVYFEKAATVKPNSVVINNYNEYADKVIKKYPYIATEKPDRIKKYVEIKIPNWVKTVTKWWSEKLISDSEFAFVLTFVIKNKTMEIPLENSLNETEFSIDSNEMQAIETESNKIPDSIRANASLWINNEINDQQFVSDLQFLINKKIIIVDIEKTKDEIQKEKEYDYYLFDRYIQKISKNVSDEKRYIEFPNPSKDVIKKFLRDYVKWNFEAEAKTAASNFPYPTYKIINGTYVVNYKVFVNEQPIGLPLDHINTLQNSFAYWEKQELDTNGNKVQMKFEITEKKHEANVWVTWIVRNIGDGVLGHAHLGKGIVEVTLGDYNCDGSFELYDIKTVEQIMTHELGHSIGLRHVSDVNNIMYPSMKPNYAYCLLS